MAADNLLGPRRSDGRGGDAIASAGEAPVKVLYIAGVSHCGSTFLGALLGQIEGFFFTGELAHTARSLERGLRCGCGAPLAACPVWREIFAVAFEEPRDGLTPPLLRLRHADERARGLLRHALRERGLLPRSPELDSARRAFVETLRAIRSTTGSRIVVDSTKSPAYGRLLQSTQAVDLFVLHLVRDPRATAWSWRASAELTARPASVALIWDVWNPVIEMLWARRRSRYLRLRYEDFAVEPEASIGRILAFVGESRATPPFVSDHTVQLAATHSVSGNPNRFRTGPVEVALDERWLSGDGLPGRRAVDALTFPLRVRYRYAGNPRRADPGRVSRLA